MANEEHLKILKQGVEQWNKWRLENAIRPDLRGAYLRSANLSGANLFRANLFVANLSGANLSDANLSGANLSSANLSSANLSGANLSDANLSCANLSDARLQGANLTSADLSDADLSLTDLVETNFTNATIAGCRTYGASAWNVTLVGTVQHNLVITKQGEPVVTVDDPEVGQFIYLMLNNTKIRNVINTITSKAVLILGRFTDDRKAILECVRRALRDRFGLVPILFDFPPSASRDLTETIQLLASMCRFVLADLTDAKSIPQELNHSLTSFRSGSADPFVYTARVCDVRTLA
jgi:hypothetical protein